MPRPISGSQFLRHLPQHWNSIMLPPHRGQTKLIIEEIMLALGSPGTVSTILMFALLFHRRFLSGKDCRLTTTRGAAGGCVRRIVSRGCLLLSRSEERRVG